MPSRSKIAAEYGERRIEKGGEEVVGEVVVGFDVATATVRSCCAAACVPLDETDEPTSSPTRRDPVKISQLSAMMRVRAMRSSADHSPRAYDSAAPMFPLKARAE